VNIWKKTELLHPIKQFYGILNQTFMKETMNNCIKTVTVARVASLKKHLKKVPCRCHLSSTAMPEVSTIGCSTGSDTFHLFQKEALKLSPCIT
jgi:hypothetical protein